MSTWHYRCKLFYKFALFFIVTSNICSLIILIYHAKQHSFVDFICKMIINFCINKRLLFLQPIKDRCDKGWHYFTKSFLDEICLSTWITLLLMSGGLLFFFFPFPLLTQVCQDRGVLLHKSWSDQIFIVSHWESFV